MSTKVFSTACLFLITVVVFRHGSSAAPGEVDISGSYSATGRSSTGVKYQADVFIFKKGDAYTVRWVMLKGGEYSGVGLRQGDYLAVAYEAAEGNPGLVLYHISSKKILIGKWTAQEAEGHVGYEMLTRDLP